MGTTLTELEAKPGSRKGRPNHDPEFRRRLAAAACEPGVSVSKLARDNGINANMLFTWRRRYREQSQAETASLIPVTVVKETRAAGRGDATAMHATVDDPAPPVGTIEIRIGRVVVKVDGARRRRHAAGRAGEPAIVISLPTGTRVWIVAGVTDMRCGFQGLAAKVQTALEENPLGGNVFIFRGRRGDLVKVLWATEDGLWLLAKRLERGRFVWPQADGGKVHLSAAQLSMLLEGIDWRQPRRTAALSML